MCAICFKTLEGLIRQALKFMKLKRKYVMLLTQITIICTHPVHFNCFEIFTHFESPQYILERMKGLRYKKQNSLSHIRTYAKPQIGAYFRKLRSHLMSYFRSRAR